MMSGSLQSSARLEFEAREGQTVLARREAGGLCHVGKGYWDGDVLGLHLVNPTAGIFAGDEFGIQVRVGEDARVSLVTPSATRFHAMKGKRAHLSQRFHVQRNGFLEFLPEWTIPQEGSEVRQTTQIDIESGASLIFGEMLAPGRVAFGESHRFRKFGNSFELRVGGRLVARERMDLRPEHSFWPLEVDGWETCFYGGFWMVGFPIKQVLECEQLESEELKIGFSELEDGVVVVRILAARGLLIRKTIQWLRERLGRTDSRLCREPSSVQNL